MRETDTRMTVFRRLAAVGCVVVAAVGFSVGSTATAQASSQQCQQYLRDHGYLVGTQVRKACETGQAGGSAGPLACYVRLVAIEVEPAHATAACNLSND
ncbi:hypothetical protein [Streptomyces fulvoviolaceus]|uniref:hypothetical protein n=1 Tax=Streptomyces fulvoviolaceus TaxID=285535 RepID=UPI0021BE7B83|nr:hypothetical protein [Streptomyces fulvoviolaceus]MCT9081532.1 hypothetical protein [Streptomyces fulvoviolaceus]